MPDQTDDSKLDATDQPVFKKLQSALEETHATLGKTVDELVVTQKALEAAKAENKQLKDKLKSNRAAPTGDVVFLGGVSHPILTTVRANTTFDEVKKGVVDEGATLVVIAKPH